MFKRSLKHKRKLIVVTAGLVLIVGVLVVVAHVLNGPAAGTIDQHPVLKQQLPAHQTVSQSSSYVGKYISFTIPKNYRQNPAEKSGAFLEIVNLLSTDHSSKFVAISVLRENISNDPSVSYRRSHPALYKADASGLVFTKNNQDGAEYTGYLIHGDLVAAVSLTCPFNKDLSADYQTIVKSWQWK